MPAYVCRSPHGELVGGSQRGTQWTGWDSFRSSCGHPRYTLGLRDQELDVTQPSRPAEWPISQRALLGVNVAISLVVSTSGGERNLVGI